MVADRQVSARTVGNKYPLAVLLVVLFWGSFSAGREITVDDDGPADFNTIQAAIDDANGGDVVRVFDGTYTGVGNRGLDFKSKAITVRSENGPAGCTIDCQSLDRGFFFHSGEGPASVLEGFTITGGNADFGGGVECDGASPTISNCVIQNNTATYYGGGLDLYLSSAGLQDCVITNNSAKYGGGINCDYDAATIFSCEIATNTSTEVGGGISCYDSATDIRNCLITNNTAGDVGGAVYIFNADCWIGNCTIANNTGHDQYGGIFCDYRVDYEPTIINSILWNNGDDLYNCQGRVSYTCVEDGDAGAGNTPADPLFVGPYYLSSLDANQLEESPCIDAGLGQSDDPNIGLDAYTTRTDHTPDTDIVDMGYHRSAALPVPQYKLGTDVIGVTSAGTIDPCWPPPLGHFYNQYEVVPLEAIIYDANVHRVKRWVGADNVPAPNINFNTATMTANRLVQLEFEERPIRSLTVTVVSSGGRLKYPPRSGTYTYRDGEVVTIQTLPSPGYYVKWTGTDNNLSVDANNTVTMNANKSVTIEFRLSNVWTVGAGLEFGTIEAAIAVAQSGDRIIVAPGSYTPQHGAGIDFGGKNLTLQSEDPENPAVVAQTIIDCEGERDQPCRAFHFHNNEDNSAVLTGFTIINGYQRGLAGADGTGHDPMIDGYLYVPIDPMDMNSPPRAEAGHNSPISDGHGGGILCDGASPTIRNCVIRGCIVTGGQGGDGAWGLDGTWSYQPWVDPNAARVDVQDGQWAGAGGVGFGNGYGGGMACINNASPVVRHCIFEDNMARGGRGGTGGTGGDADTGARHGGAGWGGDGIGDGFGGGIYVDSGSNPIIVGCVFTDGTAGQGWGGIRGEVGGGGPYVGDVAYLETLALGGDGWGWASDFGTGHISGGGISYMNPCQVSVETTDFVANMSGQVEQTVFFTFFIPPSTAFSLTLTIPPYYVRGGAIYSDTSNTIVVSDSNFAANLGSALYCDIGCTVDINRCVFQYNTTDEEGGAIFALDHSSVVDVNEGIFTGNEAVGDGGALRTEGDFTLRRCSFARNRAASRGGALHAYDSASTSNPNTWLTFNIDACVFSGNQATDGGAAYAKHFKGRFDNCYVGGNGAWNAGGMLFIRGDVVFTNGTIYQNIATGGSGSQCGGGLVCNNASAVIENSVIRANKAVAADCSGGGVVFYVGQGSLVNHLVKNCLFADNEAAVEGGAILCKLYVSPMIQNCTFSGNTAGLVGGSVACDSTSSAVITDTIFANSDSNAISEENIGDSVVEYCVFYDNRGGDYVVWDSLTGDVEVLPGSSIGVANIEADPVFAHGPFSNFYLDQASSPAVDSGSVQASERGLHTFTTDPDPNGILDQGQLDRGYHYWAVGDLPLYGLTLSVIGGVGGSIEVLEPDPVSYDPNSGVYSFYAGTEVSLRATQDPGYRLLRWLGTMDDPSPWLDNMVAMISDRHVSVEFYQPATIFVAQDGNSTDIQRAIDQARDGDTVVVPTGVWRPAWMGSITGRSTLGLEIVDKGVTIMGTRPDQDDTVSPTVLENLPILIHNSPGHAGPMTRTIIDGISMRFNLTGGDGMGNESFRGGGAITVHGRPATIRYCQFVDCLWDGWDPPNPPEPPDDGLPGFSVYGAGVAAFSAEVDIRNCLFRNCTVTGGNGADGDQGVGEHPHGFDGGWAGKAYGGGVYIDIGSTASLIDCNFIDCVADGGNGGNGGDSSDTDDLTLFGGRGGNWEWADSIETGPGTGIWWWWDGWDWGPFEDYWRYSGYGGAVYTASRDVTKFVRCTFASNTSNGGHSGRGGLLHRRPFEYENIENFGGSVYVRNGTAEFIECAFEDSLADTAFDPCTIIIHPDDGPFLPDDIYISYGGAVAAEHAATVKFVNCNITDSRACMGGGIYWSNSTTVELEDSNVINNTAYYGGGLYSVESDGVVSGSSVLRNRASRTAYIPPPNDFNTAFVFPTIENDGGGYYCLTTLAEVVDSVFEQNRATGSGGGIYIGGSDQQRYLSPVVANCLLTGNVAFYDGGAISCNLFVDPVISNCTIVNNRLGGIPSYGGGLASSYDSSVDVVDSILWNNRASHGAQAAVRTGMPHLPRHSSLQLYYSDVGPSFEDGDGSSGEASSDEGSKGTVGSTPGPSKVLVGAEKIYSQFEAGQEKVKVIVSLKEPARRVVTDWRAPDQVGELRAEIAARQADVLASLVPAELKTRHIYKNQTAFSGEVSRAGLDKLLANPMVAHVEPVRYAQPALRQSIPLANVPVVRDMYDGSGMAIAVVDTGVDYTHPMLGGGGFPNNKVIGGYDTGDNDLDPAPDGNIPGIAHGTLVAGIAAGDLGEFEDYIGGVAYGARIYALKASEANSTGFAFDALLAAWDWCITHQYDDPENPIRIMNNSWALWGVPFDNPFDADNFSPAFTAAAAAATAADIAVLAAAGNDGFAGDGITWPAAMSRVISVGAVHDDSFYSYNCFEWVYADKVTCYSNTAENLDILAPGEYLHTTDIVGPNGMDPNDYYAYSDGTSSACPFAAGAVALLQSAAYDRFGGYLSPEEVRNVLVTTGDPVTDTKVPITKPRINLGAAINGLEMTPPVFVDVNCWLNDRQPSGPEDRLIWDINDWDPNAHNFGKDPEFVVEYYLSHVATGQDANSPCVDAGSDLAVNVGMDEYTTRTDGVNDINIVDVGYHYRTGIPQYELTVYVIDSNDQIVGPVVGHGYVDPNSGFFYRGAVVTLTAHPEVGYRVARWVGTDSDASTALTNTVTMTEDKVVKVEFEPIPVYQLTAVVVGGHGSVQPSSGTYFDGMTVPLRAIPDPNYEVKQWTGTDDDLSRATMNTVTINGADAYVTVRFGLAGHDDIYIERDPNYFYTTIQAAIDAAVEGDVVIVTDGIYSGFGNYNLHFNGIPVTVRSKDGPDNCIIDCQNRGRGWIFEGFDDPLNPDPNLQFVPEDPNYIVRGLTIMNGFADYGGGMYYDSNAAPLVEDCIITSCRATQGGGGLYFQNTGVEPGEEGEEDPNNPSPFVINCKITDNRSYTHGGGVYCTAAAPRIIDSEITGNVASADAVDAFGGGIYCQEESSAQILNCLIAFNWSTGIGGSVYLRDSSPTIRFCTVAYNWGADYGEDPLYPNPKGGICCRDAEPTIDNCIIGRNGGTWFGWGVWGDPWSSGDDLYNCEATYSCIENEEDAGEGEGNISDDPLWVAGVFGPFYLSQFPYQLAESPCVDAGAEDAWFDLRVLYVDYGLGNRTTCIINQGDTALPDMGYHYPYNPGPPLTYTLRIEVIGNGTTDPAPLPEVHEFTPGTWVNLIAIPDPNHRVVRWVRTDDDSRTGVYNSVRMYADRYVTVEFEQAYTRVLNVVASGPGAPGTYVGIQAALDAAREGDVLLLQSGTYPGLGYTVLGKNVTIASTAPKDPTTVAATVINCSGELMGGIRLLGTPGGTCVLDGLTIANSTVGVRTPVEPEDPGMRGYDGGDNLPRSNFTTYMGHFTGEGDFSSSSGLSVVGNHVIANCVIRDCNLLGGDASNGTAGGEEGQPGGDGGDGGDSGGAGIYVGDIFDYDYVYIDDPNDPNYGTWQEVFVNWGGSPTFINCLVEDCTVVAGDGANGGNGADLAPGGDGGVCGRALGGGIYCDVMTSPTFIDCTIRNCQAIGGDGGNGGDGGEFARGGYGGLTLFDPNQTEPWRCTANGGAVFCDVLSAPTFIGCSISDSNAEGSMSGLGGISWAGAGTRNQPRRNYHIPSFGAGVYCEGGTDSAFTNCDIRGNLATYVGDQYTGYGGGVCLDGSRTSLHPDEYYYPGYYHGLYDYDVNLPGKSWAMVADCNFADNSGSVGGGVYALLCELDVNDCRFGDNLSYVGGGLAVVDSTADILDCTLTDNLTSQRVGAVDPNLDPNMVPDANLFDGVIYGAGGGLYCFGTDALVKDCVLRRNDATGSGGAIYFAGNPGPDSAPQLDNCLLVKNTGGKDGGGVSANWYTDLLISNCTIVENRITRIPGYGGGLFCGHSSEVEVIDSIIWDNIGSDGSQVAVGGTGASYPLPSKVRITYSDVQIAQEVPEVEVPQPVLPIGPNTPDYFVYGTYDTGLDGPSYGLYAWVGEDANDRIILYSYEYDPNDPTDPFDTSAYIYTVTIPKDADPHSHLSNPYAPGPVAPRTLTLERSFELGDEFSPSSNTHCNEFYVDPVENAVYIGASYNGVLKYVFDSDANNPVEDGPAGNYVYDSTVAPPSPTTPTSWRTETLAYDADNDIWYAGGRAWDESALSDNWEIFSYDGSQGPDGEWEMAFTYHPLPPAHYWNHHHDGLAFVNGHLFVANMYGDHIMQFTPDGTLVNLFRHEPLPGELESMGWGALGHFWIGTFSPEVVEFGGGLLQIGIDVIPLTPPIDVEPNSVIHGWQPADANFLNWDVNSWDPGTHNIDADPNFAIEYYLSHIATDQDVNSPCIDAGSDLASNVGMDTYTTRLDGVPDANIVDMGYHYSEGLPQHLLTVLVLEDPNDPGIHGYVDPNGTMVVYEGYLGNTIMLTAYPDPGYRVKQWTGTDNDSSKELENEVTVTADTTVTVEFEQIPVHYLTTIVVGGNGWLEPASGPQPEGVVDLIAHPDPGYRVRSWAGTDDDTSAALTNTVTLTSDQTVAVEFEVARTVHVSGDPNAVRRAVDAARSGDVLILLPGIYNGNIDMAGKDITLTGTNPDDVNVVARTVIDCNDNGRGFIFDSGEGPDTVVNGLTIINGSVTNGGGGIHVGSGSSPKIMSVVIRDCNAGLDINDVGVPYGGGIFVGSNSSAEFINVTVINCSADSGGGAFCMSGSSPIFTGCTFIENAADSGGGLFHMEDSVVTVVDCNFTGNMADLGGGLYSDADCSGSIVDSVFIDNDANVEGGGIYMVESDDILVADCDVLSNSALRGAGVACFDSWLVTLLGCEIRFNMASEAAFEVNEPNDPNTYLIVGQGGGVYCFGTAAHIKDCLISNNFANTSGGGVYLIGAAAPWLENCLIVNNQGNRDGGGVSVNWYCEPKISNCTISGNAAPGTFGRPNYTGFGGGLYCAYFSNTSLIDSILWNNGALHGREIAVGTGFDFNPYPSKLTVSYSDVKGGQSLVEVESLWGSELIWGAGNINLDPLFAYGPLGYYYLSQVKAGESLNSPCVNTGSDSASSLGLNEYTTRTDEEFDRDVVDMGYHHPLSAMIERCRFTDLIYDGFVDFRDYALFALQWLGDGCSDSDHWCGGADFTFDTEVDYKDLAFFTDCWLMADTVPPYPDPAEWDVEPHSAPGLSPQYSISMTAAPSADAWGWPIEYYFECVSDGSFDSEWQSNPTYEVKGLALGTELCFHVKVRDGVGNETAWSVVRCAIASGTIPEPDEEPPAPAPWIVSIDANEPNTITMTAKESFDSSEPVEYEFQCTSGGGHSSAWQVERDYTDVNLVPDTEYCYRVRARDSSPSQNKTEWSDVVCVTTPIPLDTNKPTPDPMLWDYSLDANGLDGTPRVVYLGKPGDDPMWSWGVTMRADPNTTDDSGYWEFYFECKNWSEFDSGWISLGTTPPFTYTRLIGQEPAARTTIWRVRAQDGSLNRTEWSILGAPE